jgi:predicted nucleotidyltransferase
MNTQIYNKLKELKPQLKDRFGIEEFAIFGSVAKGTDTKDSDVDIAILKMNLKNGFDVINAQYFLKEQLNRKIDIGSFKSMKTFIKNRIKKDFIYV